MAVIIRIYDVPTEEAPFFVSRGLVTGASSIRLVERHYIPGYFTVEVPTGARHAQELLEGRVLLVDGAFWGIVDDVGYKAEAAGDILTVSGRQLKGLTADRITIPPGSTAVSSAQGYDTAMGSTETVIKHFVAGNMSNADQPARVVFGLEIAADQGRGLADDKYMSRHEPLDTVLSALGEASGLGYDIAPDLARHRLVFDVVPGEDHTGEQSERTRVVFDVHRKTALSQAYAHNTGDARNLFYATMGGAEFEDEALTVTYVRDGEDEPVGIRRREVHMELSVDTPTAGDEYNELKRLALIEAENYRPAESFTCEIPPGGRYQYRKDFKVGDLVTVRNMAWGVTMDTRLTEMETQYSASDITLTATFGKAPLTVFGRLRRQINKGS